MCKGFFVYILTNKNHHILYVGVTNNLKRRIFEHKNHMVDGFTKRYHADQLIYFEQTKDIYTAISREKQIKGWKRSKKIELIHQLNLTWRDLYEDICR